MSKKTQLSDEELAEQMAEFDRLEAEEMKAEGVEPVRPRFAASVDDDDVVATVEPENLQEMLVAYRETDTTAQAYDPELMRVIQELESIAFSNIVALYECRSVWEACGVDEFGETQFQLTERLHLRDFTQLPEAVTACIQTVKIKHERGGDVIELKFYDKLNALEKLMRFRGGYAKENEQRANAGNTLMDMIFGAATDQGLPVPKNNDA